MDSLLVLFSASLVGFKILDTKRSSRLESIPKTNSNVGAPLQVLEQQQQQQQQQPPQTQEQIESVDSAKPLFIPNTRPPSMNAPGVAEVPSKRLSADEDDGTGVKNFNEQFFPQDSRSTGQSVVRSPWMRAVESSQYVPPKTEREATHPSERNDRDDMRGMKLAAVIRERERHEASQAISKLKKFQSPVTEEWTGNGEKRGLHPIKRYHKFLLSDQPVVEMPSGPRGNFASGADKPSVAGALNNNKKELHIQHTGIPGASFGVGIPAASFELNASNAEHWEIDAHVASASRAPVDSGSNTRLMKQSFSGAHDESLDTLAVADKANLSQRNLPFSAADAGSSTALQKSSFTPAHDNTLDPSSVARYSNPSKQHFPSRECPVTKESFRLAHDHAIDLQAIKNGGNICKTHQNPSDTPAVAEVVTRDRGVDTPSMVGASGGTRQKHADSSFEVKTIAKKEDLTAEAQAVSSATGMMATKPSAESKRAEHEHADQTLAEEDTRGTIRGAPHTRRAADTSRFSKNQFSLDNCKDAINDTPFTSENFTAPQNQHLPAPVRVAPTASISLSQKELSVRQAEEGLTDMLSMGRNRSTARGKVSKRPDDSVEQKETRLRSVVQDRTTKGVVLTNPYSKPRPIIQ